MEPKVTVLKLEQWDLWSLRQMYGQTTHCYACGQMFKVGDVVVKVRLRVVPLPRLYHSKCFNAARVT